MNKVKFDYYVEKGRIFFQGVLLPRRIKEYIEAKELSREVIDKFNYFSNFIGEDITDKVGELMEKFETFVADLKESVIKVEEAKKKIKGEEVGGDIVVVKGKAVILNEQPAIRVESINTQTPLPVEVEFDMIDGEIEALNPNKPLDSAAIRVYLKMTKAQITLRQTYLVYDEEFEEFFEEKEEFKICKGDIIPLANLEDEIEEIEKVLSKYAKYLERNKVSIPKDGIEVDI